jgi:RNA polymerase sigma factor (sigma-70 family)
VTALVTDSGRTTPARLAGSAILACQSDERLVDLVRQGHERAFEAIVARYRRPLVRYSARILPESRTEDAVQQAFINAHAALLGGNEPLQLKSWLFTITRNAALNMLRQNGWNYDQIPLDFDGVRRPDQVVEQRIELQNTVAAVSALPDRQRDAIVMREFEGRSYDEIGVALGANDGAVRQLLNRARGSLRAAATALMPPPIVTRIASSLPSSDGRRVAEVVSGLGAAGLAKAGATVLVAGSLVVGAVNAPLPLVGHDSATRENATLVDGASSAATSGLATLNASTGASTKTGGGTGVTDKRQSGKRRSGSAPGVAPDGSGRHSGTDDRTRAGSDDSSGSGSGDDHSGPGSGGSGSSPPGTDDSTTGTDDHSGSSSPSGDSGSGSGDATSGSDSSGSGSSGGSGSDDGSSSSGSGSGSSSGSGSRGSDDATTVTSTDTSGSGSGSSGSGSSGSGSSGSGSDNSLTATTLDTSGSGTSGSGTSGSGTSGSGSGGHGSDDPVTSTDDH